MRVIHLVIPACLAMACAGAALVVAAQRPTEAATIQGIQSVDIKEANVRHLVTDEMIRETKSFTRKPAPTMVATDTQGEKVTLGAKNAERPQFVYFVLDGCPCSFDAEPLFHDLYNRFKGKVDFVSVTDANAKKAKEWSLQMLVNYPVISDPEKRIIHAYEAKASVYSALVSADGHIVKMWPGYSAGLLQDMNETMAAAANVPAKPFDTKWAPKQKATGCAF